MYLGDDVKGVRVELAGQDLVLPIFIYVIFLPKKWILVMTIMLMYTILWTVFQWRDTRFTFWGEHAKSQNFVLLIFLYLLLLN